MKNNFKKPLKYNILTEQNNQKKYRRIKINNLGFFLIFFLILVTQNVKCILMFNVHFPYTEFNFQKYLHNENNHSLKKANE